MAAFKDRRDYLAVVGLGYVGLPLAVAFADRIKTIGFDINQDKIRLYQTGVDPTCEVGNDRIRRTTLEFTSDSARLREAQVIIIAVPTPINGDKTPNLGPVAQACELIGENLSRGSVVILESTVYPGVTEKVCAPIIEQKSGLTCGRDFKIAYSPERINPGDKVNRLENIRKIVAGMDAETTEIVAEVYQLIITAGIYRAPSSMVAEAANLAENAQRDINIAFMNELAMVFERMGIRTFEVIEAMNTKWNALGFYPGLVGGHCIGVDPYYFIYQAETLGYHSQIIAAGRKINEDMSYFLVSEIIKKMIQAGKDVSRSNIYLLGLTFKENVPDTRNSKAVDVVRQLTSFGLRVNVVDPFVSQLDFNPPLEADLVDIDSVRNADCLVFLVGHRQFAELSLTDLAGMYRSTTNHTKPVLIDVKNIFSQTVLEEQGYVYWSL